MRGQEVNFAGIKQAVTMEAVLRYYQIDGLKGGRGGRYRGRCPLHQGEGEGTFHVDVQRKIFHCFSCGAGGDVLDLVALLNHGTLRDAALQLQGWVRGGARQGDGLSRQRVTKGNQEGTGQPGRLANPPLPFTLRGVDEAHAYLAGRAIDERTAGRFGVGYYRGPGLMSGRVVVPIHDERGRLVAYAGRAVDGRQPRYLFPAGFRKSQVLFNFHRAAATCSETVVVVEGFFDCLRVHQAGLAHVVALLGMELYEHPAQLLCARFGGVVLMLDGDEAGRLGTDRVAARLRDRCKVGVVRLPEGAQPDQLPGGRLRELISTAAAVGSGRERVAG